MRLLALLAISGYLGLACCSTSSAQQVDDVGLCCDVFRPRWFARGAAVYMHRVTESSRVLVQNINNPSEQLNANDFQFDWEAGFDVALIRRLWDDSGGELRYLDLGTLDETSALSTNGPSVRIGSQPPIFAPNVQQILARYQSEVRSVEANYHHAIHDEYLVHIGLRHVSLDETLQATLDANPQTFGLFTSTRNDLYGAQVGASGAICQPLFGCVPVWASGKIGVYGNDADQQSWVDAGAATVGVAESTGSLAYVGELGISAHHAFGRFVTMQGGYGLLWLGNVAVAGDQLAESDFFAGTGSTDDGDVILHGARLAIELYL